ncbi:MAG: efflux RND transporter permease subunit [Lachnospiraceae bacterium]
MNLTKLALKRPVSAVLIILALVVFGISSIFSFKLELQPEMEMPMLLVVTVYPGADPQSVEELVTKEIEGAGAILSGVDSYTSQSSENSSVVMFSYDYGVNIDDCYMDLRTALDATTALLPEDCKDPYIMELNMNATDTVTISATAVGDVDLLSYVEDSVEPELKTLLGVADVKISGGSEDYIKITLNEESMNQYGLTMENIAQYISAIDFDIPAGSVQQGSQDMNVSSSAKTKTVSQLQKIPIATATGNVVTLADVAQITQASKPADSISRYDGDENVTIGVQKKQSQGTVNVARDVVKTIEQLQKQNEAVDLEIVYNASEMIIDSLTSVGQTLLLGILLSMLVLFIFFGDLRASFIVGSAMPISLFVTLILMNAMGFSLNLVTTGSLVIAIGMMVDNSIVVLESCFRIKDEVSDYKEAALRGTRVVTGAIVASTITTVVVYFPLSVMKGLSGQIFKQLGFTIMFAMLASLVSALTLIPLFFMKFHPREKKELWVNRLLERLSQGYEKVLKKILYRKKTALVVSVLLLLLSGLMVAKTNMELMPTIDEGTVAVAATFRSGTKLDVIDQAIAPIEEMISQDTNVSSYNVAISGDTATITAYLNKKNPLSTDEVIALWNQNLSGFTGMDIALTSVGNNMTSMLAGGIEVDLSGQDMQQLKIASAQVEEMLRTIPGVTRTASDVSVASTKAEVIIDPLKAMSVGLTPVQVAMNLGNVLSGLKATVIKDAGKEYNVMLEYPKGRYDTINSLLNISLATPYKTMIPLRDIATISYTDAPEVLSKVDGIYQVAIKASTTSSAKFSASKAVNAGMDAMKLPDGVTRSQNMMEEMITEEFTAILKAILVAVFLVFLVMAMQFESPKFSGMVMMSIPFSMIGSFALLYFAGATLSMVSLMGVLMLVGIVVNNGILYVDTVNQLREEMFIEEALIRSGQIRMRPILMTTLTTILSMIPLGLGIGEGGALMQGMALVIIGGLITSTILILILIPSFYLLLYQNSKKIS